MNNKAKVPKIYDLILAFFIITICILGSQLLFQHIRGELEHQKGNNTSSTITHSPSSTNNTPSSSISVPLSKGYVHGKTALFIATDASDNQVAESITKNTGFKVNFAPDLALTPDSARQQGYDFVNGIKTSGSPMGFQLGIASALPGEKGYSPLYQINFVKWNANATPRILKSTAELMNAQKNRELDISKTNIVINSPAIMINGK
ncbi:MAG TPA: hypothetical protein VI278_07385 [Nitrososphaeraceae archaeon]